MTLVLFSVFTVPGSFQLLTVAPQECSGPLWVRDADIARSEQSGKGRELLHGSLRGCVLASSWGSSGLPAGDAR